MNRNGAAYAPLPGGPREGGGGTIVLEEVGPVPVCTAPDAAFCDSLKGGCSAISCAP